MPQLRCEIFRKVQAQHGHSKPESGSGERFHGDDGRATPSFYELEPDEERLSAPPQPWRALQNLNLAPSWNRCKLGGSLLQGIFYVLVLRCVIRINAGAGRASARPGTVALMLWCLLVHPSLAAKTNETWRCRTLNELSEGEEAASRAARSEIDGRYCLRLIMSGNEKGTRLRCRFSPFKRQDRTIYAIFFRQALPASRWCPKLVERAVPI